MRYLLLIVAIFILVGCVLDKKDIYENKVESENRNIDKQVINIPYTPTCIINVPSSLIDSASKFSELEKFRRIFINCVNNEEHLIDLENISIVHIDRSVNIRNYGNVQIIEILVQGREIADLVYNHYYLIYNSKKQQAVCFSLDKRQFVKVKSSDSSVYFSGTYIVRGKGYFFIYDYVNGQFNSIFNSGFEDPDNAVFVYKMDLDCINYKDSTLIFENRKINQDSLLDLNFKGTVQFFCKKGEEGFDRTDRAVLKEKKIAITYLTKTENNKVSWSVADSSSIGLE